MEFKINYKDHAGRKNNTTAKGKDYIEAEKKFKTLYPDCYVQSVEVLNNN
jgi:hypothetical protein